jgi:hypothetical protein
VAPSSRAAVWRFPARSVHAIADESAKEGVRFVGYGVSVGVRPETWDAAPGNARREREDWWTAWSALPSVERDRPAADVLAEIRDDE